MKPEKATNDMHRITSKEEQSQALLQHFHNTPALREGPRLTQRLWDISLEESAQFVNNYTDQALLFNNRTEIHNYAFSLIPKTGLLIECGVYKGDSLNAFAKALSIVGDKRVIYGFDSFIGLQEDWSGHSLAAGHFSLNGSLPSVENNARLIPGWIDDTFPAFLTEREDNIAFLHVDTDTYKPCKSILQHAKTRLACGAVLIFDELLAYPGWKHGEYKALTEEISPKDIEWKAFAGHWGVAIYKGNAIEASQAARKGI